MTPAPEGDDESAANGGEPRRVKDLSVSPDDGAPLSDRKAADAALALPLAGLALLSPPVIGLFATDARVFGAPGVLAYLFFVWAVLTVLARLLSRRLKSGGDPERESG